VEVLLIWAVQQQKLTAGEATRGLLRIEAEAMGLEWRGSSTDGCASVAEIGRIGCRIDVSPGGGAPKRHPVADLVAELLERSPQGGMLLDYARAGARPKGWRPPERWVRPEAWTPADADAAISFDGRRNGPRYCPVIISYDEAAMEAGRDEYERWRQALAALAWLLSSRALGFVVTGPAAPAAPWKGVDGALQV
jgi:hypothetical protein